MTLVNRINRFYAVGLVGILSILSPHAFAGVAVQHSLFTESGVGFNQNTAQGNDDLSFQQFTDGTPSNASVTNQAFTGMDRTGTQQTMTFSGVNHASASYGRLRLFASGIVTNNYYNSSNPKADNGSGPSTSRTDRPTALKALALQVSPIPSSSAAAFRPGIKPATSSMSTVPIPVSVEWPT